MYHGLDNLLLPFDLINEEQVQLGKTPNETELGTTCGVSEWSSDDVTE